MNMEDATAQFAAISPGQQPEDAFDQELEGIDLAELDSILDQGRSGDEDEQGDRTVALAAEETGELDESDLDMDFESELALDDDRPADSAVDAAAEPGEDLDLDMDFELDAAAASDAPEMSVDDQVAEDELDMDFELGEDLDQQVDAQEPNIQIDEAGESLGDDIDSVLDGFEAVLNDAEEVEEGASPASAEAGAGEPEEDIDLSDLEDVLETPDDTGSAAEEAGMGDFETALNAPSEEEETTGEDDFDIDLSDLDMDLDMDLDEEEGEEAAEEESTPTESGSEPSLDEELTLDEAAEPSAGPAAIEEETTSVEPEEEVFDLSDLDGLMDLDEEEEEPAQEAAASDEDTELSLDDLTLDEAAEPPAGPAAVEEETPSAGPEEEEVFDLSDLDGLMDLDEEEGEPAEDADSGDGDTELSLDEDLSLDLEEEAAAGTVAMDDAAEAEIPAGDGADELDLGDLGGLDTMLDEDQPTEEDSGLEDLELSLDDESDGGAGEDQELTLEMDDGSEQAGGTGGDELDLGGLDGLLDEEEGGEDSGLEDLELSLDDEPDSESTGELSLDLSPDDETGEPEDLEFSLDSEFEDSPATDSGEQGADEKATAQDEELDLTDLEQMLESETLVPDLSPQGEESELSLTGKDEKFTDRAAETLGMGSGAELDLSEIEAAIDSADEDTEDGGDEELDLELDLESPEAEEQEAQEATDDDLELDLEMESDAAGGEEEVAGDDQEAIDLSDLKMSLEDEKEDAEGEVVDAGDMELEFQIEDEMEPATIDSAETMPGDANAASFAQTTVPSAGDTSLIEEAFSEPAEVEEEEKPAPEKKKEKKEKKKKGSNALLIFILVLVLLGAGGFFGYQYVVENNIQIPYLDNLIHPQPQDPSGTAKLTTLDINSKFIDNEKGGRIFVVTGKVRNGYPVACNKIRLQGKLFTKGKVLAKTELTYAGVMINDQELGSQDVAQIKQRLKTGGGQTAELVANPGQTLPFMVVFSELPDDLDEFAIELINSTKVQ